MIQRALYTVIVYFIRNRNILIFIKLNVLTSFNIVSNILIAKTSPYSLNDPVPAPGANGNIEPYPTFENNGFQPGN